MVKIKPGKLYQVTHKLSAFIFSHIDGTREVIPLPEGAVIMSLGPSDERSWFFFEQEEKKPGDVACQDEPSVEFTLQSKQVLSTAFLYRELQIELVNPYAFDPLLEEEYLNWLKLYVKPLKTFGVSR